MGGVNFLNIEYFLLLAYQIFTGTNVDISQIPEQTLMFMRYIAWTGLAFSVLTIALFIFFRRWLHEVEHEGWRRRDEEIYEIENREAPHPAKNAQWEHVLALSNSPLENDWRRAVIEADILLDAMLTSRGYSGNTLGDKLKTANPLQFTTLDLAWRAHKVRNDIAHAGEQFHLTDREAKSAIDNYRRVFDEFGAL